MFDVLIKNAEIYDGSGAKPFVGSVAVKNGKIAAAGDVSGEAAKTIDARGLALSPGFIDSHSHADLNALEHRDMDNIVKQGITTIMGGQCGGSAAPCRSENCFMAERRHSVKDYFEALEDGGTGTNISLFIGHGNLRDLVMGELANRKPTDEEMAKMKKMLSDAMDEGARGLNSGMYYTPCAYADTDEIVELCKTVAEKGGMFAAHIRSESKKLIEAVQEMIDISERSGVTTVISHHKAAGGPNYWGLTKKTTQMIEEARGRGVRIWCDVYPYNACSTSLWATYISTERQALGKKKITEMLKTPEYRREAREWIEETFIRHSWHEKGLSWALMVGLDKTPEYNGMRISEAAKKLGKDEFETLFDILVKNECDGRAVLFTMNEEDVENVISKPYAMIGTDSSCGIGSHPRYAGTFPRALGHYVRERGLDTFEGMIYRMTGLPAKVYKLSGKGFIKEGMDADICVFDKNVINALSTFEKPNLENVGLEYVLINGELAIENGKRTKSLSGKPVRMV
ncbi:MAG: D-aminoacylase, partial [Clostridia bacterium]|nr:D-aminoacylase [Clostridia bacterium]